MAILILLIIGSVVLCWEGVAKIWDSEESLKIEVMVEKL